MVCERSQDLRDIWCQVFWWSGLMSLGAPCAAQEVDPAVPAAPERAMDAARSSRPRPGGAESPREKRIDLKLYGFYIGGLDTPVAQVDVPIRATKFLTVTPSYMYYSVPASGLNKLPPQPGVHRQLRRAPVSNRRDRGVRRSQVRDLRPQHVCQKVPSAQWTIRTAIAEKFRSRIPSPLKAAPGNRLPHTKPFTSSNGGWNRERIGLASRCHSTSACSFQPSYMWETSRRTRDVDYVLFGLIVNTR